MLCLDFGTSFSKAFVSVEGESELDLIELPLGDGTRGTRLATPSELFIDGKSIFFGAAARPRWDDIQASTDRLIDSIKQFITLNMDVTGLGQRAMPTAQDQSQKFSQRDILVLYLAHLTALTERAASARGLSQNLRRRFTHPAWKERVRHQNEQEMRRLMAEAIVLARSSPDEFTTVMRTDTARVLLDQLASVNPAELPFALIGDPVREATAAGAGALLATREGRREAYLVLDIGAGTTDVAGFYCVNNPNNDRMRVFEVSSAADAKNIAGNTLDNALQRFVLDQSGLSPDSAEARLAGHAFRRQARRYKEQLFRTGRVIVELATDQVVDVDINTFLAYAPVVQFNKIITEMVARSTIALAGDLTRVNLVATGGGPRFRLFKVLVRMGSITRESTLASR
jgi:molecular chaperone DnaK